MTKLTKTNENGINYIKSENLLQDAKIIIDTARDYAYKAVNFALVKRNWLLGKRIAEEELRNENRAEYGAKVIFSLAEELTNLYPNVINLLISNKKSSQNKFRGFYIPYSLRQHSKAFDSDLTELDGIESSIESAEQMKDNLSRVKNIIRKDLDERLKSIENEIRKYRKDTFRRTSNQRIVDIFSSHVHFYENPAKVEETINQTIQQWNNRKNYYIYC